MIIEFYGTYANFLNSALIGMVLGIIYDIFRILRIARQPYIMPEGKLYELIKIPTKKIKPRKNKFRKIFIFSDNLITFAEDIIFWIIASFSMVLFIYHANGGVIRIYFIIFYFIGAALYFFTIGKITIYFSVRIIFLVRCLLYWSFYIIIYPVRLLFRLMKNIVNFIFKITVIPTIKIIWYRKIVSYSQKRSKRILIHSKKGFFTYD
jgi:hypothetical protein